jgi:hypothetical protein
VKKSGSSEEPAKGIYERYWLDIEAGIITGMNDITEKELKSLAEFWMPETRGEWKKFNYGYFPVFDTPVCAVAAIARKNGFAPSGLSDDEYSFLEAGLAIPEPDPLYPGYFCRQ